ncbi:protein-glutamine gamma-glutamyltransferase 2-like [Oncorhynchus nerka]|uniref:protein-glutamine gamma-glutamyltransferase 2-like n=1 Tax=Oncorhynchus nerka TaxID=8023 RepID=UPI0031B8064F
MIVAFREQQREHPPIHIDGTVVERVVSFKFLGVYITDKLNWSTHTDNIVKNVQQRLFNLRRLKKFAKALTNFYRCTIESILVGCITAWYGNCSAHNRKAHQREVRSAQRITGGKLPALTDTYTTRLCLKCISMSVLRCLGIPCRVVTNFQSAHDTDKNLTIDDFFSDYGVRPKQSPDSVWNYHVWVEAWMTRPDLSAGSLYDGWQAVDPTPQEKSTGVYCCGPAPVKAILQGHVDLKYDVPFVFAEVNADRVTWMVFADGSKKKISTDSVSVGQSISTKAVGSDKRVDITANYKHAEGTEKERDVYNQAVKRVNIPEENSNGIHDDKPGVSMKIVELTKPVSGKDIDLELVLNSNDNVTRTLVINVNVQAMRYNGIPSSQIQTELKEQKLLPNQDLTIPIHIPFSVYGEKMRESNSIKVSAVVTDKDKSGAVYITEKDLVPESPLLTIKVIGSELQYSDMTAEVVFENPLSEGLRDCFITVTGSGLLTETMEARTPLIKQGQRLCVKMPFTPYRPGPKKLVAGFNCDQFRDIKASCNVYIKPSPVLSPHCRLVGLITNNNETADREEIRDLAIWCQNNDFSLNMIKPKEMIVDNRKKRTEHAPILIAVDQVESLKFLGAHIINKLTWSKHTKTALKRLILQVKKPDVEVLDGMVCGYEAGWTVSHVCLEADLNWVQFLDFAVDHNLQKIKALIQGSS